MKSTARSWRGVVLSTILLTVLSLAQPAFSEVEIVGSWVTGLTHAKEVGTSRVLIFIAQAEYTSAPNLSGVTYGGRPMSKIIEKVQGTASYVYTVAYWLGEADIAAATSGTFEPTWTGGTPANVEYISVFLDGVGQTTPIGPNTSAANTSGGTLTGAALATSEGDMVLAAATCSSSGTFNFNNGFTEEREGGNINFDTIDGYKAGTGESETPSVTHSASSSRKTLIGFVVKGGEGDLVAHDDRVAGNMMLINDNAGWCWYQDDKIIYDPVGGNIITSTSGGDLGFGGASGETRSNDVDATTFNIATGKRTRVLMAERGGDDHNMGGLWIRPDGRYLHLYCPHYSNPPNPPLTYYRVSTNPNDGSTWDGEQSFNWSTISGIDVTTGGQLTYTNLHYITGEGTGNGRLYDVVRWNGVTPNIAYSDDWGATWQYMGKLNSQAGGSTYSNYYHKFRSNGVDRIDFIGVENHPRDNNNNVYHGYIKNGKGYNSLGTVIDDDLYDQDAPSIQAYTPIFIASTPADDTYHTGWTNELELDKNGYPVCLYQTRYGTEPWGDTYGWWGNIGCADHRFFYARFNGTSWTSTELAKMGPGLHWREQDYIGMGCIHPDDVNVIYISTHYDPRTDVNTGFHEIYKGVTPDNGVTWNWTPITSSSTVDNIRPAIPKWNANNTAVFWERGDFPLQGHFDMVMVGLVEEQDVTLGLVSYIDASTSNTTNADGSLFSPTGPSGSTGTADDLWHEYTGYGNGGSCFTAGDGGIEDVPTIKTTITGLSDGTYDVFAYFWCDPSADWGIRGGFTSASSDMLCFNKQSSQFAEASQFSGSVTVTGTGVQLYRVYIGRKGVSGGAPIVVYLDNYDSTYTVNAPTRTTYDGVGVASVITGCIPGDLNCNGKVDLIDFAILGQDWLTIYNMDTLADIADNWLYGT